MGITFECHCGCVHASHELVKVNNGQFRGLKKRCPQHKANALGNIKQRFNTCIICKETFPVKLSGRARVKCPRCSKIKIPGRKITLDCAQVLKEKELKTIPGHVTNFYECGCIVPNMFDANTLQYFAKTSSRSRSCPFHSEPSALIAKYKVCGNCGNSQTGWAIQSSEFCQLCSTSAKDYKKRNILSLNNSKFCDADRWDCSRRDTCFDKYIRHATIPCKNCGGYDPIPLETDPFRVTHDELTVYSDYIYL